MQTIYKLTNGCVVLRMPRSQYPLERVEVFEAFDSEHKFIGAWFDFDAVLRHFRRQGEERTVRVKHVVSL